MKIVIEVPDDRIGYRSRAAHCLRYVAEFFEARPADTDPSGALTLGPRLGIISWSIEGVQQ